MISSNCHDHDIYQDSGPVMDLPLTENTTISTPDKISDTNSSLQSSKAVSEGSSSLNHSSTQKFRAYSGNPQDPIDSCIDEFLSSEIFELICVQAVQLAAVLPTSPPPNSFVAFDSLMHHWYQALLIEFVETFLRRLRALRKLPVCCCRIDLPATDALCICEHADVFSNETIAHVNAILISFNTSFATRYRGSTEALSIDTSQPNAFVAALALQEATSLAEQPPKKNWRVGEPLHAEYKRRLRMFEAGVTRLVAEREELRWMLGLPGKLERGIVAYEEYYIACLREEILKVRSTMGSFVVDGLVVSQSMEDVFN